MDHKSSAVIWMGVGASATITASVVVLAILGTGERGVAAATALAARVAFAFFWLAYTGRAIGELFGPSVERVARCGREFGLAFAAALLVHLVLVVSLFRIAARPPMGNTGILYFGLGAVWTYALALYSVNRLRNSLSPPLWRILRGVGMEYIAFLFFLDFVIHPLRNGFGYSLEYAPFAILIIVGPVLRLATVVRRRRT